MERDACESVYRIGEVLGTGSFATVKKAVHREDGSTWAVKCIERSKLEPEDEEALKTEVQILFPLRHPHIVTMREVFDTPRYFYMVLEVMTGGELFDRVVEKSSYSEAEAARTIKSVADALAYCHDRGIVHRDLKPECVAAFSISWLADVQQLVVRPRWSTVRSACARFSPGLVLTRIAYPAWLQEPAVF
jgi:calcium/calmodulin-dependent protein kinase I